jgi:tetratricopeptide (TPR) repeat protein/anti-sigma regulatory factor (Ser/Thr protein kinase)
MYNMPRLIPFLIFYLAVSTISVCSFAQKNIPVAQRKKIDSLKKIIQTGTDSAKTDNLILLGNEYARYNSDSNQWWSWWNPDTARLFTQEALNLARKISYKDAEGRALMLLGLISLDADFEVAENYTRQAIPLFEKLHDEHRLAGVYGTLGWYLYAQSKFESSREYENKSLDYFIRVHNNSRIVTLYRLIGFNWDMQGYAEKAFECTRREDSVRHTIKNPDTKTQVYTPRSLAMMYENAGDHERALYYYRLSAKAEASHYQFPENIYEGLAENFATLHVYDSAEYYHRIARKIFPQGIFDLAGVYMSQNQFARAVPDLEQFLLIKKKQHDNNQVMFTLENLANCYKGLHQYDHWLAYSKELIFLASRTGARPLLMNGYELMWKCFDKQRRTDSAYKYHLLYTTLKDSLKDDEFIRSAAVYDMKSKNEEQKSSITILNKENQLKETRLQHEKLWRYFFVGAFVIGLIVTMLIVRNFLLERKRENLQRLMAETNEQLENKKKEQLVAELLQQKTELEMQVLRSQMNPHFIFNSLSSINRFILQNNKTQASEYLTKFSKLMRLILENSQAPLITLESELESLKLYLDLEALRFNYRFGYKISVAPETDTAVLKVPPLIVQPYVENAIWHGLMHKEEKGQLDIEISREEDHLFIRITDDGVGRKQSAGFRSKSATLHKPMGLQITAERIAMMERSFAGESSVTINDLVQPDGNPAGTEVTLKMPAIYD